MSPLSMLYFTNVSTHNGPDCVKAIAWHH